MILSFRHKGLQRFFETGSKAGIRPQHARKLRLQLGFLQIARTASDMALPGYDLHLLKGDLADHWSISVNGNWRLTFRFAGEDIELVDYQDYH